MKKEFVMRGQTASGETEVLNFSGYKPGYAYRLTEFILYPAVNIGGTTNELLGTVTAGKLLGTVTAGKTAIDPPNPNFNDEGLIAVAQYRDNSNDIYQNTPSASVLNDTFLITQNLQGLAMQLTGSADSNQ